MSTPYERSSEYSNATITTIREQLEGSSTQNMVVAVCGSYARREASRESDLDYFVFGKGYVEDRDLRQEMDSLIRQLCISSPSQGGPFEGWTCQDQMLQNIGGDDDSNKNITRRVLLLLEGEWLFNARAFRKFRRIILERYISTAIPKKNLARFLLNDIIRYYRTIAVDYEFKTLVGPTTKPWATRLLKLVFSRKLLYASGLFSVAMTHEKNREQKVQVLDELFSLPVMERMACICGHGPMKQIAESYNLFLEAMENRETRIHLENLQANERSDPCYRELKDEGHRFNRELVRLLQHTFKECHPIHQAVLF